MTAMHRPLTLKFPKFPASGQSQSVDAGKPRNDEGREPATAIYQGVTKVIGIDAACS
jgi:hypothetical protein